MIIKAEEIIKIIEGREKYLQEKLDDAKREKGKFEETLKSLREEESITNKQYKEFIAPYEAAVILALFEWSAVFEILNLINEEDERMMGAEFEALGEK